MQMMVARGIRSMISRGFSSHTPDIAAYYFPSWASSLIKDVGRLEAEAENRYNGF